MANKTNIKFTKDHLFKPRADSQFTSGKKKTIIGWLQELYLFNEDKDGYIDMRSGWRAEYEKAEGVLRKVAGLTKSQSLILWEQTITPTKAATLLNKVQKEMNSGKKKKKV